MTVKQIFHSVKLGFTRCYLLKCSDGYLLVDTSDCTYFRAFQKRTAKLGINLSEIKYVLLTHHHDDHAGFAAELVNKTGCRVVVHQLAVSPLKQGRAEYTGAKVLNRRVYATMIFYSLYYILFYGKTYPPLKFSDRDIVLEGDNECVPLTVPGRNGQTQITRASPGWSTGRLTKLRASTGCQILAFANDPMSGLVGRIRLSGLAVYPKPAR